MDGPLALCRSWRAKACVLQEYGDSQVAAICELHASELETWWREYLFEPLSVKDAAEESGYSESHLYHALALEGGALPNAGKPRAPRIRRCDLPRKPGTRGQGLIPLERAAILADLDNT